MVNGSKVIEFEVSKAAQYAALAAAGFDVPRTVVVAGREDLKRRALEFPAPFITKHNQGGKGLGVRRFDSHREFDSYVDGPEFEEPADGITLLQEFVQTAEPFITRAEFVGGEFVYAVRVDTSEGSFELCPAEACAVPGQAAPGQVSLDQGFAPAACEIPGTGAGETLASTLFAKRDDITAGHPLIVRLRAFLADQGIEVAGVEFFETADGRLIPYDINTNTNYNPDVEAATGNAAATALAGFLGRELESRYATASV
ncbi:ATP-grasp domain-containing protein [Arthrobacter sp. HMWF013]|uniref:ATP-grasp domain-containing protein n=1 Tax=Arthrobacter sp. HMWF013 TaxID=2056849 RepID=UPI002159E81C|nr:alpha-L-glutamate ligase [Arthrobacter sp. HMWF013]